MILICLRAYFVEKTALNCLTPQLVVYSAEMHVEVVRIQESLL